LTLFAITHEPERARQAQNDQVGGMMLHVGLISRSPSEAAT
jgi:hypothetical protein